MLAWNQFPTLMAADELDELLRGAGFTDVELTLPYGYYSPVSRRKP